MSEMQQSKPSENKTEAPKDMEEQQSDYHPQPELRKLYGPGGKYEHASRGNRGGRGGRGGFRSRGGFRGPRIPTFADKEQEEMFKFNNPRFDKNYENPIFRLLYSKPLETEEDIKQYIEERRKNYPTKKNVEKRHNELEERRKRGEIIVTAHDRIKPILQLMNMDDGPSQASSHRGRGNARNANRRGHHTNTRGSSKSTFKTSLSNRYPDPISQENNLTNPPSTDNVLKASSSSSSSSSDINDNVNSHIIENISKINDGQNISNETENLGENLQEKTEVVDQQNQKVTKDVKSNLISNKSSNDNPNNASHNDIVNNHARDIRGRRRGGVATGSRGRNDFRSRSGGNLTAPVNHQNKKTNRQRRTFTLLQRLLANDVKREKDVILQCLRYIVNKNFFCETSEMSDDVKRQLEHIQQQRKLVDKEIEHSKQVEENQKEQNDDILAMDSDDNDDMEDDTEGDSDEDSDPKTEFDDDDNDGKDHNEDEFNMNDEESNDGDGENEEEKMK